MKIADNGNVTGYARSNMELGSVFTDARDKITGSISNALGIKLNDALYPSPAPAVPAPISTTSMLKGAALPLVAVGLVLAWRLLKRK
jgi:hypothetical protein